MTYDARVLVSNLVRLYQSATPADIQPGRDWYPAAHRIMREWSDSFGLPLETVALTTAAISPQCEWTRNLIIADDVLSDRPTSLAGGAIARNVATARRIVADRATSLAGYFKEAPKVASFAQNLAGDYRYVTVDTHIAQAALNNVTATPRLRWKEYQVFAEAVERAAGVAGLEPAHFQAVVWHTWKRLHPAERKRVARRQWSGDLGEI